MQDQELITRNRQEKAALIWAIADKLVGVYKPHEYGNVILPMCVIKRFEDTLAPTRQAVWDKAEEIGDMDRALASKVLARTAGQQFFNTSKFTFQNLLADPDNIAENFTDYLQHFSDNVIDIIRRFKFHDEVTTLADKGLLYLIIKEFNSERAYLGADRVSAVDMGYIFEDLVRRFSESYDEQAGAHFTARDIIYVMADLLIGNDEERLRQEGVAAEIYDMTMGTSQMLAVLTERLTELDPDADVNSHGQELNDQTFAIAKADTLIKGGNAENMRSGDTLGDDQFRGYLFDYIISNPPFGIEWKTSRKQVEKETGDGDRFAAGLPAIGDGQMLFMLNGVSKIKPQGRMAIIQNGSPLFKSGKGENGIRRFLLENDYVEAIVQLPNDIFYNTGIATYIWMVTKDKAPERRGRVQLIDASQCYEKRRKSLGNKRVDITDRCRQLIRQAYLDFTDWEYTDAEHPEIRVESRIKRVEDFKSRKVTTLSPRRLMISGQAFKEFGLEPREGELTDRDFFQALKDARVKFTQKQVEEIRGKYGRRDADAPAVYVKPLDPRSGVAPDPALTDTEIIPWTQAVDDFISRNVRPYAPDVYLDPSREETLYEIPFTREFYRYTAPRPAAEIFDEFRALGDREQQLMTKILAQ